MSYHKLSLINAKNFLQFCKDRRVFVFLGKTYSWGNPDTISQTQNWDSNSNLIEDFNDTVFAKLISESNISLVIRRIDWEPNKIFDQWNDSDPNLKEKDFYCLTSSKHVYKCISNNKNSPSTVEPNVVNAQPFQTADGYVWKYMFSVNSDDANKFLTPNWIPVREIFTSEPGYENQYASQVSAIPGTVDRIELIEGGSKYSSSTTITIIGDGSGATATYTLHPITKSITDIVITNPGQNYTWAKVLINDPSAVPGSGASAKAILSPIYGHGYNPAEELFASDVMLSCSIEDSEGGFIKNDISFRKLLLVIDPKLIDGTFASNQRYDNTSKVILTNVSGNFVLGEKIIFNGGYAYITYIEPNALYLSGLMGQPSGVITGSLSSATGTVTLVENRAFRPTYSVIFRSYFEPRTKLLQESIALRPVFSF